MRLNEHITLLKLARNRLRSEDDYRNFQSYQAALIGKYLKEQGIPLSSGTILDLGSGLGGYSREMLKLGATVISLDLINKQKRFGYSHLPLVGNALYIPIRDETIDFVFCASLIEHISDPWRLLKEIKRVLKSRGYCYLSFPPFYSIRGGHQFSPFHYLGECWALRLSRLRKKVFPDWITEIYGASSSSSFATAYQGWGLFKLTIGGVRRIVTCVGMGIVDISTRYLPINTARWPLLGEFLTWHVQFLIRKD
ncbi:MAG: class I SAM-dependent methyltransferase [Anaerolineae bacterium]